MGRRDGRVHQEDRQPPRLPQDSRRRRRRRRGGRGTRRPAGRLRRGRGEHHDHGRPRLPRPPAPRLPPLARPPLRRPPVSRRATRSRWASWPPSPVRLASFGVPDKYCAERWREYCGDGLVCGDGKKHPVTIEVADSQSDSNRAAQVAGDLINNTKVDIMMVASTPDTVTPVVEQCESYGCPVVSTDCPWQTYMGPNKEYKWSYHVVLRRGGLLRRSTSPATRRSPSNKIIGAMYDNTADGNFFSANAPRTWRPRATRWSIPSNYQAILTEDFTAQIAAFKNGGVELIMGNMIPPDFTNFWKQAMQQGLEPKACLVGKAILFPQSVEALGDVANGLMTELWWHRTFPWIVLTHRRDLRPVGRRLRGQDRAAADRSAAPLRVWRDGHLRPQERHRSEEQGRRPRRDRDDEARHDRRSTSTSRRRSSPPPALVPPTGPPAPGTRPRTSTTTALAAPSG